MERRKFLKVIGSIILILARKNAFCEKEPEKKEIILTIDDGPKKSMEEILNLLGKNPAIFYVIGERLEKEYFRGLAKKAIQNGHILGNHSYSHPLFSKINFNEAKNEIERTEKAIEKLYREARVTRERKLFRFPYGEKEKQSEQYLKSNNFQIQRWDVDSKDWEYYSQNSPLDLSSIILNCKKAKKGDIVLVHDLPITSKNLIPIFTNSKEYKLVLPF
jgi:peptidoglycan/xylan/chitin deacetylase (PgdA/CDA1 family)